MKKNGSFLIILLAILVVEVSAITSLQISTGTGENIFNYSNRQVLILPVNIEKAEYTLLIKSKNARLVAIIKEYYLDNGNTAKIKENISSLDKNFGLVQALFSGTIEDELTAKYMYYTNSSGKAKIKLPIGLVNVFIQTNEKAISMAIDTLKDSGENNLNFPLQK